MPAVANPVRKAMTDQRLVKLTATDLIRMHESGELSCASCGSWKNGECWSADGLEAIPTTPVRYTSAAQFCEAWCEREPAAPAQRSVKSALGFWRNGTLDRKYLRVSAVYRLLKHRRIGKARALELLAQQHSPKEMKNLQGTIDLWREFQIKEMLP